MKKIFIVLFLLTASGVCGYARDVRVLLKDGVERKGELTVTNEDSVFIKFKNGVVRKFPFANIDSVTDEETGKDILPSLVAESKSAAEKASETGRAAAEKTPAESAVKAPEAEKATAAEKTPAAEKVPEAEKVPAAKKTPAVRKAADTTQSKILHKPFSDNVMAWMAARYDAKTMLGFKWEHPDKARLHYAFEDNNSYGYGKRTGFLAKSAAGSGPAGHLDIVPVASVFDSAAASANTNSYLEARYARTGAVASWNAGFITYSETINDDIFDYTQTSSGDDFLSGSKLRKTNASVVYASLLLTLPIQNFAYYGFIGPAVVSYDYSESGTFTNDHYALPFYTLTTTTGVFSAKKSGTILTWILGVGFSFRLSDSGFGIFGEYKHLPQAGTYPGADIMGAGLSFGF